MGRYNLNHETDVSRGQMILAGTIALLAMLIILVTISNIALVSESERQGGIDSSAEEVKSLSKTAEMYAGHSLTHINQDPEIEVGAQEDELEAEIEALDEGLGLATSWNSNQITTRLVSDSTQDGYRIVQNDPERIEEQIYVDGADQTRVFSMGVMHNVTLDAEIQIEGEVDGESESLTVELSQEQDDFVVSGGLADDDEFECRVESNSPTYVDFLGGGVDETTCGDYPEFDTVESIAVERNEDNSLEGTIGIVITDNEDAIGPGIGSMSPPPEGTATPQYHEVIYAAEIEMEVATDETSFFHSTMIAPSSNANALSHE